MLFTLLAVRGSSPPRSLRSVWGKYTRFCCVAERARRGRETAVFSLVRVFIALRDIVEVCPSRGMVRDLRARYACFCVFGHANFAVLFTHSERQQVRSETWLRSLTSILDPGISPRYVVSHEKRGNIPALFCLRALRNRLKAVFR